MKFHNLLFAAALVACTPLVESTSSSQPISPYDVLSYVDPFVGTGGIGAQVTAVSPSAAAPFGMTLIGPDTRHSESHYFITWRATIMTTIRSTASRTRTPTEWALESTAA